MISHQINEWVQLVSSGIMQNLKFGVEIVFPQAFYPKKYFSNNIDSLYKLCKEICNVETITTLQTIKSLFLPDLTKEVEECTICCEDKQEFRVLGCSHRLCYDCFFSIGVVCPFCRKPITKKVEVWNNPNDGSSCSIFISDPNEYEKEIMEISKTYQPDTEYNYCFATIIEIYQGLYESRIHFIDVDEENILPYAIDIGLWVDGSSDSVKFKKIDKRIKKCMMIKSIRTVSEL